MILKGINHRKKICQKAKEKLLLQSHKLNPKQNLRRNLKEDPLLNQKTKNKDKKVQKNNLIFTIKWKLWIKPVKLELKKKHKENKKVPKNPFREKNHPNNQLWKISKLLKEKINKSHKLKNN